MGFFEFGSEFIEASGPAPARPSPSTAPQRPAGSTSAPASSTRSSGSASGRGAATSGTAAAASDRSRRPATPATTPTANPPGTRDGRTSASPGPAANADRGPGFSFDRFAPYIRQGWDFVQTGTQIAQQFAGPARASGQSPGDTGLPAGDAGPATGGQPAVPGSQPAGYSQPGYPSQLPGYDVAAIPRPYGPGAAGQPAPNVDLLGVLLQALRQRQIPPLPGPPAPSPVAAVPAAPAVPQADAISLLRLILGNPQFQQALQSAPGRGAPATRTVDLPVPATTPPRRMRSVPIPLGAVMNAIFALAGQSMTELNENTSEDDPEVPSYLVDDEGDFLVDPASPDDRAALVAHLFRLSDEAQHAGRYWQPTTRLSTADNELDECDMWAREAGFTK